MRTEVPALRARAGGRGYLRGLLLLALLVSAGMPLVLLLLWSSSGQWFYPDLVPREWSSAAWLALAGSGTRLTAALRGSLVLALLDGLLGCAAAFPLGRTIARLEGRARHVAAALVFAPVAAPPIAFGIGIQFFFLRLGLGGTAAGVLLAHLVPTVGYLSLYFIGVFTVLGNEAEDEARSLGASGWQVLLLVSVPMLRRQVAEAIAVGFLISWSQYALTLAVGGGAVHTLPLEVFAYMRDGEGRYAAAAALVMVLPPLLLLTAVQRAERRSEAMPL